MGFIETNRKVIAGEIVDGAITTAKIGASAVTSAKVATFAITGTMINSSAITSAKIAGDSIVTSHISDAAITAVLIANSAITNDKYGQSSIGNDKIMESAVGQLNLAVTASTLGRLIACGSSNTSAQTASGCLTIAHGLATAPSFAIGSPYGVASQAGERTVDVKAIGAVNITFLLSSTPITTLAPFLSLVAVPFIWVAHL